MRFFRRRKRALPDVPVARRVRELEVVTSRLVRHGFAGQYHAAFHGQGIEFSQVREYQPGDDIRTIDWNVTARSGVPHVKQFVEERDLTVLIALDVSASMNFGSIDRRKSTLASEVVAALAYAALHNGDRIGLVTFDENVRTYDPPRRGRVQVQAVVRRALTEGMRPVATAPLLRSVQGSGFPALEAYLGNILVKRSVIVVLSDFLQKSFARSLRRLDRRHDVVAMHVHDPRESLLPRGGIVRIVDSESGARMDLDLSSKLDRGRGYFHFVREEMRRAQLDLVELSTAAPYERELVEFFQRRVARVR